MRRRVAILVVLALLGAGCSTDQGSLPGCNRPDDSVFALIAQSVPSATQLPCLRELPVGWNLSDSLIRDMWDVGLAHRDIKPANLMVQDGHLKLIDVFFVQVRPSPWRQAVDLANMMLVLGLRSDARRVYDRALEYFTPQEIGEAFAATRGVASPTQLRSMLKEDGRDLLEEFRSLAPPYPPVRIQRWSVRRVGLALWVLFLGLIALSLVVTNWTAFA